MGCRCRPPSPSSARCSRSSTLAPPLVAEHGFGASSGTVTATPLMWKVCAGLAYRLNVASKPLRRLVMVPWPVDLDRLGPDVHRQVQAVARVRRGVVVAVRVVHVPDQHAGLVREPLHEVRPGVAVAEVVPTGPQGVVVADVGPVLRDVEAGVRVGHRAGHPGEALGGPLRGQRLRVVGPGDGAVLGRARRCPGTRRRGARRRRSGSGSGTARSARRTRTGRSVRSTQLPLLEPSTRSHRRRSASWPAGSRWHRRWSTPRRRGSRSPLRCRTSAFAVIDAEVARSGPACGSARSFRSSALPPHHSYEPANGVLYAGGLGLRRQVDHDRLGLRPVAVAGRAEGHLGGCRSAVRPRRE